MSGSDEVAKAQTAKPTQEDTIFGKIARKEIPVDLLHDDDQVSFFLSKTAVNDRGIVVRGISRYQ